MRVDRLIAALANRQQGVVTRAQLLELGLNDDAILYRIKQGRLIRIYRGVYGVGHAPTTGLGHATAAVLACGHGAALAGDSAVSLWGWRRGWRRPIEVVAPSYHARAGIRPHRWTTLTRADITTQLGIRVTSPARTMLDIAPRMTSEKALNRLLITARESNFLTMSALANVVERNPRHPGRRVLLPFLGNDGGLARSDAEFDFPAWCERHGLPRPQRNVTVAGYEIDFWFEEERVAVEVDGRAYHLNPVAFERDRERDAHHLEHGILTVRVTTHRLRRTAVRESRRLQRILEQRRPPKAA